MRIISRSVIQTQKLGKIISKHLNSGDIVCLEGNLGTGKTVLTKGIAQGLGVDKTKVTSSSFILIRQHLEGRLPLYHFDLYRLSQGQDIASLGYEEYLYGDGICVIEWAERLNSLMPKECLMVELAYGANESRIIKISAYGLRYIKLLKEINEDLKH
jgi:tRNA threonylcarbamoyladenosine biosynthesis protein TsaE